MVTETEKEEEKTKSSFLDSLRNSQRFEKLSDGWIKDNLLGIDWAPSSTELMNWEKAKKYCADQGGRLPEVNELHSLVDYTKRQPAINTEFFSDTKTDDWYWTGTTVTGCAGSAWMVYFSFGNVYSCGKVNNDYVRPVRASQ